MKNKKVIIECNTCKFHKKGYCKVKRMNVSINATFCDKYKETFIPKIKSYFNNLKQETC